MNAGRSSQPPGPPPPPADASGVSLEEVASGQRLVVFALLLKAGAMLLGIAGDSTWGIAALLSFFGAALAVAAVLLLASGFGYSRGKRAGFVVLAFVPLVSLVMLLVLNAKAMEALRGAR